MAVNQNYTLFWVFFFNFKSSLAPQQGVLQLPQGELFPNLSLPLLQQGLTLCACRWNNSKHIYDPFITGALGNRIAQWTWRVWTSSKKKTIEAQAKISNKSEFMISLLAFTLFLWLGGLCFVCLIFGVFLSVWGFFHTEAFAILWWKFKWKNSSVQLPWDGYGLKEHPNLFLWECWAQRKEKGCSAGGHSWTQHMWKGSCQIWKYLFKATINCSLALGLGSIFPQIAQLSLQHRLEWENCQPLLALLWAGGLLSYRGKGFLHSMRFVILFTVRKWHLCYHFIC